MANDEIELHILSQQRQHDYNQQKVADMEGSAFEKIAGFRAFTFEELQTATGNFSPSNMLGEGSNGQVFQGLLDGKHVAVKRLHPNDRMTERDKEEFIREIRHLAALNHKNILSLMGFCLDAPTPLLVTEKLHSLHKALYEDKNHMNWSTSFEIAMGVVKGLVYLHTGARRPMLHCDIKPGNILLDPVNLTRAYIADFGVVHVLAGNQSVESVEELKVSWYYGTPGYMAPEARAEKRLSQKSDVYSFGKLLYALFSGKVNVANMPASLIRKSEPPRGVGVRLKKFANRLSLYILRSNKIEATVAPAVVKEVWGSARDLIEASTVVKLIVLCTQDKVEQRPSMERVRLELESATTCEISWTLKTAVFVGIKTCRWLSFLVMFAAFAFFWFTFTIIMGGAGSNEHLKFYMLQWLSIAIIFVARKVNWEIIGLMYWNADDKSMMLKSKPMVASQLHGI